jgi:hypothetical protein
MVPIVSLHNACKESRLKSSPTMCLRPAENNDDLKGPVSHTAVQPPSWLPHIPASPALEMGTDTVHRWYHASGAVRGECLLPGGLQGCCWCAVWCARGLHYYTDWKHQELKCICTVFCGCCDNTLDWIASDLNIVDPQCRLRVACMLLLKIYTSVDILNSHLMMAKLGRNMRCH